MKGAIEQLYTDLDFTGDYATTKANYPGLNNHWDCKQAAVTGNKVLDPIGGADWTVTSGGVVVSKVTNGIALSNAGLGTLATALPTIAGLSALLLVVANFTSTQGLLLGSVSTADVGVGGIAVGSSGAGARCYDGNALHTPLACTAAAAGDLARAALIVGNGTAPQTMKGYNMTSSGAVALLGTQNLAAVPTGAMPVLKNNMQISSAAMTMYGALLYLFDPAETPTDDEIKAILAWSWHHWKVLGDNLICPVLRGR